MTRRGTLVVLLSCAAAAVLGEGGAAEASTPVPLPVSTYATETRPTPIDTFRGHAVWSHLDAARRFRLVHRFAGRIETLPIRSRGVVFDADLGPDARNRVALVYSRCAGLEDARFRSGFSNYRRCDLYRYDFATRRETRLRTLSTPTSSERFPSLWHGRIAFLRSTAGKRRLFIGDVESGRAVRVPVRAPAGVQSLHELELHGRHLAFVWTTRIPDRARGSAFAAVDLHTHVWLHDLRTGGARLLNRQHYVTFAPREYLSPSFGGGYVYFGVRTDRSRVFRWPVAGGRPQQAPLPDPLISVQRDRGAFTYVLGADRQPEYGWPCRVGGTDVIFGGPSPERRCTVGSIRQVRFVGTAG